MECVTRMISECFMGVLEVFQRSVKGISREFQRWFSQVLGVLQECFKEISRNLKCVLSASMMLHGSFKISTSMFNVFFKFV